jgi:octaprenyl-diphosphate synthase
MPEEQALSPSGPITAGPTDLKEVQKLSAPDMARVDQCIRESLTSDVVLVNQVAEYIIASGGKRLRPMLLVLGARACGYRDASHWPLAAIIEFIHTATLLHDDVVDESATRRGKDTAHAVWGNSAAVLVGDFLYSRSFQMMVTLDSMRIMEIMADTTNTIAEGEVLQLLNLGDPEVSEDAYFKVIDNKTAKLFEAACRLSAVIARQSSAVEDAMARYGTHLGRAFQIADDLLDYSGDETALGKNTGDDLAEGKPTLPLILARNRCSVAEQRIIDAAVTQQGSGNLEQVLSIIRSTGALASTYDRARSEAEKALRSLQALPPSEWREALETLALYSYQRTH